MPAVIPEEELSQILAALQRGGPKSLGELREALSGRFSNNELRYRLQRLRERGDVVMRGERRRARYAACSGARQARAVGYRFELLETYEPNVTHYLTRRQRDELRLMGETSSDAVPAGTYARQIFERLLIDLSWASSRLEGNTYDLLETENLIALGTPAPGKDLTETQMILNHKRAIEFLVESAAVMGLRRAVVLNLHALLVENLLADPALGGALRKLPVYIGKSSFIPLSNPHQIDEQFERILALGRAIDDPFEQGFFVFAHIAYLQPFIDGNKRTARLALNISLIQENLRPLTFVGVERDDYLAATLAFYESADPGALADLFVEAYGESARRYDVVADVVAKPDPFRIAYRDLIIDTVSSMARERVTDLERRAEAVAASQFETASERAKFVAAVLSDVRNLHEGNFMRFGLTPQEFDAWLLANP